MKYVLVFLTALLLMTVPAVADHQPELTRALEVPLHVDQTGFVEKFINWSIVSSPLTADVNGDGTPDYIVFNAVRAEWSAIIVHARGCDPDSIGPAVFYVFLRHDAVIEWAGDAHWADHAPKACETLL